MARPVERHRTKTDVLVVGAGYAGSVVAERLASAGRRVLVVERRPHVGGNAYDEYDEQGVLIHRYGPHIFHTNSRRVVEYLSNFTEWRPYEHRALAHVDGKLLPIPINLDTVNGFYGLDLREEEVGAFFERVREPRSPVLTSEDVVLNAVGRDLYEKFFRNYTRKHWGLDPSQLSAGVAARVPVRTDRDDRYWTDDFQALPREGYTKMFEAMLDHPNISVELGVDFREVREFIQTTHVVYTGPIDAYFDHRFGRLPYRSLSFEHTHLPGRPRYQRVATINYPNEHDYIRVTEFKHLTRQEHPGTSIVREYPRSDGDPYYPIPRPENQALYRRYRSLAAREKDVTFVGRLAQYRYYNMDQVVGAALKAAREILRASSV
ncbi:MAG: UDP-galactopyranose mutase [Rubrobacter sp.]|nr:UDP-galactopyranose mutase [Rubrobacter sp.]